MSNNTVEFIISEGQKRYLLEQAEAVKEKAHDPFSGYKVGAAVLAENGGVYTGCNVEVKPSANILHAEQRAIAKAAEDGNESIKALALTVSGESNIPPCGNCRQSIACFKPDGGEGDVLILIQEENGYREFGINELLPEAYTGQR